MREIEPVQKFVQKFNNLSTYEEDLHPKPYQMPSSYPKQMPQLHDDYLKLDTFSAITINASADDLFSWKSGTTEENF